jgi:hypothetical protein
MSESLEQFAATVKRSLEHPDPSPPATAHAYRIIGPTHAGNLLVMDGNQCIARMEYDPARDAECRKQATRMARAEHRTQLLRHLLAELDADEGRWRAECELIRTELRTSGDEPHA